MSVAPSGRESVADRDGAERPVRAIVLDFNGTLAQDGDLVARLFVDIFASVGVPLTVEEYHRDLAALPDREVFDLALARARFAPHESRRDGLVRTRVDGYLAAVARAPPIDAAAIAFVRAASERAAGMRVAALRGLGCDPGSGHADIVIDRLDPSALATILDLPRSGRAP
jgi:hypothetical protein